MCASVWQVDLCLRCRDTRGVPASASCPGASDRRRSAVAISQAVDERFVAPVSCCGSKKYALCAACVAFPLTRISILASVTLC